MNNHRLLVVLIITYFTYAKSNETTNQIVTTCPVGHDREEIAKTCDQSANIYHCMPTDNGKLFAFCEIPRNDIYYSYYVFNNKHQSYFLNKKPYVLFHSTGTEFYSNLSQLIVAISEGRKFEQIKVFEQLKTQLGYNVTLNCNRKETSILPEKISCNVERRCVASEHAPSIAIFIVDVNGKFVKKENIMPKTSTQEYALVALASCQDRKLQVIKEYKEYAQYFGNVEEKQNENTIEVWKVIVIIVFIYLILILFPFVWETASEKKIVIILCRIVLVMFLFLYWPWLIKEYLKKRERDRVKRQQQIQPESEDVLPKDDTCDTSKREKESESLYLDEVRFSKNVRP